MSGEVIRNPDGSFKAFKTADGKYNYQLPADWVFVRSNFKGGEVAGELINFPTLEEVVNPPPPDEPKKINFREFL